MNIKKIVLLATLIVNATHQETFPVRNIVAEHLIQNITCSVVKPNSIHELIEQVKHAKAPIAVAGAQASQGKHVWAPFETTIDMTAMNRIKQLNIPAKWRV